MDENREADGNPLSFKERRMNWVSGGMQSDVLMSIRNLNGSHYIKYKKLLNIHSEIIEGHAFADELSRRHMSLNRAKELSFAIVDAQIGRPQLLDELRDRITRSGAFLEELEYSSESMRSRLSSADYVIAHAGIEFLTNGEQRYVSDIQISLLGDDDYLKGREYISKLLPNENSGDYICPGYRPLAEKIISDIRNNPLLVACVEDICAEDDYAHMGFASAARSEAFKRIVELNLERGSSAIRYILAGIFSVQGIRMTKDVDLGNLKIKAGDTYSLEMPIGNVASFFIHLHSKKFPAQPVWTLVNRNVPVQFSHPQATEVLHGELITDWTYLVHDLEQYSSLKTT